MSEIKYEIIKTRGILSKSASGWANEVGNPRYILDLLLSAINVSVQTVELVGQLPRVKFE
jgi:predicted helicase